MKGIIIAILSLLLISTAFAADLSKFPEMFIEDGTANVLVIVGKAAKAEDVLGAVDIVVVLQHAAGNKKLDIAKMDDEVDVLSAQNSIIIGGPCANPAAAAIMYPNGAPDNCGEDFTAGEAMIKYYENGDNVALLVAGYSAEDTRRAGKILGNYANYDLSGSEVVVKGTTLTDMTVTKVA